MSSLIPAIAEKLKPTLTKHKLTFVQQNPPVTGLYEEEWAVKDETGKSLAWVGQSKSKPYPDLTFPGYLSLPLYTHQLMDLIQTELIKILACVVRGE